MSDDTTKIQKAINIIEKRPGIRTEELAAAVGCEQKNLAPMLWAATSSNFVVTCKVERPGKVPTVEYRLSAGVVANGWDAWKKEHRTGATKPLKAEAPVTRPNSTSDHQTTAPHQAELAKKLSTAEKRVAELEEALHIATSHSNAQLVRINELEAATNIAKETIARLESSVTATVESTEGGAIDVKDAAIGYLVRVPKRKPRLIGKPERAREAAEAAARQFGRSDVLALVPIGTARGRKAIKVDWQEA